MASGSGDVKVISPLLSGLSKIGPITMACSVATPMPSSKKGAGAKINSRSGRVRLG
ncbi:Uncharacterised protein [Mycobacteroides abscessus subsp. abscessus]|nr:Uncharacterised protein [Mycobacteroides abscessus subsp. abscessus]